MNCHAVEVVYLLIAGKVYLGSRSLALEEFPAALVEVAVVFEAELDAAFVLYTLAEFSLTHAGVSRHTYTGTHLIHILVCIVCATGLIESFGSVKKHLAIAEDRTSLRVVGG